MKNTSTFEPGAPVAEGIPLCVPEIRGNEWEYVRECLDSGWVSSVGSYVTRFEGALAAVSGASHTVATVSGTAALHIALQCVGVEAGDEVLVSALSFIAPANAIRYLGAFPVFIDAEPTYWEMDPDALEAFLTEQCEWDGTTLRDKASGRRVRAVLPVDILGSPVDAKRIVELARRFRLPVVHDVTESLGATYEGSPVGSLADVWCYSFNGNKLITTGGGGMLATNDAAIAARARYLTTQAKDDPVEYIHGAVGYNYRLTNVQAAIGVAQMEQLDRYLAIKRATAEAYTAALGTIPGITPMQEPPYGTSAFWLYTMLVDEAAFGMSSRALLARLAESNIQTRPLWQALHRSPAHAGARVQGGAVAERLCRDALSLPSSVGITPEQIETVIRAIRKIARP